MAKMLLETLTRRQIILFGIICFLALVGFFVLGGTKGADPASASIHIANLFIPDKKDYNFDNDNDWIQYQPGNPNGVNDRYKYQDKKLLDIFMNKHDKSLDFEQMVFATKIPHPGTMHMYKAFQFMLVIMNIQMDFITYNVNDAQTYAEKTSRIVAKHDCVIKFHAKLAYSDAKKPNKMSDWKLLTRVENQSRPLTCRFNKLDYNDHENQIDGYYICDEQHFFELGSVAHKHYLLNIKFPTHGDNKYCLASNTSFFDGLHLTEIHQNGGYTISLFVAKTVMFPFVAGALIFFIKRVKRERRLMTLIEKSIVSLGGSLTLLLLPVDWFTLAYDMPYMLFISDLRQGLFYTTLLIFWCIFAGEHLLESSNTRNQLSTYKWEISLISIGCTSLFIFDVVERGMQMVNPFHTIWKKDAGETLAKIFLGCAIAAAIIYAIFFCRLLFYVYRNIRQKEVALPAMQEERRMHYENLIYRYRVLIWVTLFTVFSTVICFVLDQINETSWKFEDSSFNDYVIVSSAMHFGMFGMWGIYVFVVLILYSPTVGSTPTLNVQYQPSANLLNEGEAEENEDEINFKHPKT